MAFSQSDVDALEAALAKGVKTVQYDGHSVTYRSVAEIERVLERAKRELGLTPQRRIARIATDRGFR